MGQHGEPNHRPRDGLRAARELAGLTQAELAAKVDMSEKELGRIERGAVHRPTDHVVSALCAALGNVRREDLGFAPLTQPPPSEQAQLPEPHHFVGRDADVENLVARLCASQERGAHVVTGMGGIGKTALAAVTIRRKEVRRRFDDGIVVVLCQDRRAGDHAEGERGVGERDPRAILRQALASFDAHGLPPEAHEWHVLAGVAGRILGGKRTLVVLDDLEPDPDAHCVVECLREAGAVVLVTTRTLPSTLDLPPQSHRRLGPLDSGDAVELFARWFGRDTAASLTPSERQAVERIVTTLGRHTLAIRLAAAYAYEGDRDLTEFAAELGDEPERGLELAEAADGRSVKLILGKSLAALPAPAARLFAALGCFASADCGRRAVLALVRALRLGSTGDTLDPLVRRGLVEACRPDELPEEGDRERLRLHPLVRALARDRFDHWPEDDWPEAERVDVHRALARFYAAEFLPHQRRWRLGPDELNITGALEWAHGHGEHDAVMDLCAGMDHFWRDRWRVKPSRLYLPWGIEAAEAAALRATGPGRRAAQLKLAHLLHSHGNALRRDGCFEPAAREFDRSLAAYREVGDDEPDKQTGMGAVYASQARLALVSDHRDRAVSLCVQALRIHCRLGDHAHQAVDLFVLGQIAMVPGKEPVPGKELPANLRAARRFFGRCLAIRRHLRDHNLPGDRPGEGMALGYLGHVAILRGDRDEARRCYEQSLEIHAQEANYHEEAIVRSALAWLDAVEGRAAEAESLARSALAFFDDPSDGRLRAINHWTLGHVALAQPDLDGADHHFARAYGDLRAHAHNRPGEYLIAYWRALAAIGAGRDWDAHLRSRQARSISESADPPFGLEERIVVLYLDLLAYRRAGGDELRERERICLRAWEQRPRAAPSVARPRETNLSLAGS